MNKTFENDVRNNAKQIIYRHLTRKTISAFKSALKSKLNPEIFQAQKS